MGNLLSCMCESGMFNLYINTSQIFKMILILKTNAYSFPVLLILFILGEVEVVDYSKMAFLHGRIRIFVDRAEGLPDTDTAFWNIDRKDFTDPYVTGDLGEARIFKTRYILNDLNPVWEQTFNVHVCHHAER